MTDTNDEVKLVQAIDAVPSILDVICDVTAMGFVAVARVTSDRWIACAVRDRIEFGLAPGGQLPRQSMICDEVCKSGKPIAIDDVSASPEYRDHPVFRQHGFRSCLSTPIVRADGSVFGTLCALDPKPLDISRPAALKMFKLFGDLIAFYLDAHDRIATGDAALADARQTAQLREQFIAVLGHDLRNPLAAVGGGLTLLEKSGELSARSGSIARLMHDSLRRASGLINDVLDFARGRLGGGIAINRSERIDLAGVVYEAIAEARAFAPDADIMANIALDEPVSCDGARIAQLLSNLIGNAIAHGDANEPIRVDVGKADGEVTVAVTNVGKPVPDAARDHLFEPFFRSVTDNNRQGLGLGLYIADQIARAHGGGIDVHSKGGETMFVARLKA